MKKFLCFVFFPMLLLLFACKKDKDAKVLPHATEVSFSKSVIDLQEGESAKLIQLLSILPEEVADTCTVEWKVADESIANINQSGRVTAIYEGSTVVTATVHNLSAEIKIRVSPVPIESFSIEAPKVAYSNVPFIVGIVDIVPKSASPRHVTWSSAEKYNDKPIIPVYDTDRGEWILNTAYEGKLNLTAKVDEVSANASFTIGRNTVTAIELSGSTGDVELRLPANSKLSYEYALTLKDKDYAASYDEIVFTPVSGDYDGKISIDSKNKVISTTSAAIEGTTIAKFTAYVVEPEGNRSLGRSYTIRVTKAIPLTSFNLDATNLTMELGQKKTIKPISLTPENGATEEIVWSSSNTSVLQVRAVAGNPCYAELIASSVNGGTVTVSAKTATITKTCTVEVKKIPVSYISFPTEENGVLLFAASTYTMKKASVLPANASLPTVKYTVTKSDGSATSDIKLQEGSSLTVTTTASATGEYYIKATADGIETIKKLYVMSSDYLDDNISANNVTYFKYPGFKLTISPGSAFTSLATYNSLPDYVRKMFKVKRSGVSNLAYGIGYTIYKADETLYATGEHSSMNLHFRKNKEENLYGESWSTKVIVYDMNGSSMSVNGLTYNMYTSYTGIVGRATSSYSEPPASSTSIVATLSCKDGGSCSVKRLGNSSDYFPGIYFYIKYYTKEDKSSTTTSPCILEILRTRYTDIGVSGMTQSVSKTYMYSDEDKTINAFTWTVNYLYERY